MWSHLKILLRMIFVIINNAYCIPTHCLWLLTLWPLKFFSPQAYLTFEEMCFEWLLSMVSAWAFTAGYEVAELGDDIEEIIDDRALILINHQSTSDVPLMMSAFDGHKGANRRLMWIMDRMFKKTNFGLVSWFHKDFFISSGKDNRENSLKELTAHLKNVFVPYNRTWILLFPEGGFLHKRREVSQRFALKNNLPSLKNVTVPRVGAVQNIVASIGPESKITNGYCDHSYGKKCESSLKWIVDLTIAYPNGKPLDIISIFCGTAPPCTTFFHYRIYPISEIPTDSEQLKLWVYERYFEKDVMLETYYSTGQFPSHRRKDEICKPRFVPHDGFRWLLLNLLYITSTLFHWNLLTTLYSCVF